MRREKRKKSLIGVGGIVFPERSYSKIMRIIYREIKVINRDKNLVCSTVEE